MNDIATAGRLSVESPQRQPVRGEEGGGMSHAIGAVRFESDGAVMFYEYNGTSDVTISHLYETRQEVLDNWREGKWLTCLCGKSESVEIYTSYGFGFSWMGRACRHCKAIADGFEPGKYVFDAEDMDDLPAWLKPVST